MKKNIVHNERKHFKVKHLRWKNTLRNGQKADKSPDNACSLSINS